MLLPLLSASGNNQIGFDLPVDNLKTGKVRNTFLTTYGELDIFHVSLPHFTKGRFGNIFLLGGELSRIGGRVGSEASCADSPQHI